MLFTDAGIVMIHTFSRDPLLEDGTTYKYTVALTPPLSYQGVVWEDIFCKAPFKFSALSIFVVGDTDSIQSDQQFESGRTCSFNIKSRHILPTTSTDFSAEIAIAKTSGSNIFVIFGKPEPTGALIQQAWQKGLFHEGVLVVSGERATSPDTWKAMKVSSPLSVPLAMKGFLGIIYDPSFVLRGPGKGGTQKGADFVTAFHDIDANLDPCALQDAFLTYPFLPGGVLGGTCLFSNTYFATTFSVADDGANIYPYAAHAFDAPLLFMNAFATMQNQAISGASLRDAILSLPSFPGASGDVKVFPGKPGDSTFNDRGSRLTGLTYTIFNFNQKQYQLHGDSMQAFSFNGIWTSQAGFALCTAIAADKWKTYSFEQTVCVPMEFNTANSTLPPVDHPPYSTSSLASSPKILKIGGIFSPIDDQGFFDANQAQALAAFIMAIRDINASPKVLKNIRLVYAIERAGTSFDGGVLAAQYLANTAFGTTGVVAAVSAGVSLVTEAANDVFNARQIPLVHSVASDVALENGGNFPYKLAVIPNDAYIGAVFQDMLCNHYGAKTISALTDGTVCKFQILSSFSFSEDTVDFTSGIDSALAAGSQIFFFSMFAETAGRLLLQGHAKGLFRPGTQVFSGARVTTPLTWATWDASLVATIMKGYVGIKLDPTYNVRNTPKGQAFVQAFQALPDTVSGAPGAQVCSGAFDDAGNFPLYQQKTQSGVFQCTGLQFRTSFTAPDGSDMYPLSAHVYDAAWSLAYALDLLTAAGQTAVRSVDVFNAALNNVSFTGASGCVAFYKGFRIGGVPFHRGNRACGNAYDIESFQASQFDATNPTVGGFAQVGTWTLEQGVQLTSSIVYNTADGKAALDTPLPIVVDTPPGLQAFMYVMGVLVVLAVSAVAAAVVVFRSTKLIIASQPVMLHCILLGGAVAGDRVICGGLPLTDGSCAAQMWAGHLSFGLVFGALFLKTWRVHRIVNQKGLKRIKITALDVLVRMAAVMGLLVLYLAVAHGVGRIQASVASSTVSNQTTQLLLCSWRYDQFDTTLYAIEAVILLMGARLCWATKDVPDAVNESKFIAYSMTILTLICALVFPIVFLINLSPAIQRLIASLAFAFGALFSIGILFGPKLLLLLTEGDIEGMDRKRKVVPVAGQSEDSDKAAGERPGAEGGGHGGGGAKVQGAPLDMTLLKGTLDQRALLCREQMKQWQALLMQLGERESSGDPSRGPSSAHPGAMSTADDTAEQHFDELPLDSDARHSTSGSGVPEEV